MNPDQRLELFHSSEQPRQETVAIVNDEAVARTTDEERQRAAAHALWPLVRTDTSPLANPLPEFRNSHDAGAEAIACSA